ncbi:hypothetical protein Pmani_008108 [Petrolisthes manimaculis]|uniref:Serpin domain-containing protein n=1 Tax=Petrolisthes manimaculis TaxID=1843537 RepID=A0AAE1Q7E8_9EUCA|nr:hypothetical protein Pmani_008108 [Petrolisthes manimaculis]
MRVLALFLFALVSIIHQATPQCLTADDNRSGINPDLTGLSNLGFNLYRQLNPTGNFFFSPYSIWTALGMTYLGTGGNTQTQLETALGVTDKLNTYRLINSLRTISSEREENGVNFTFRAVDRIYVKENLPLVPCMRIYLQDLLQTLDFSNSVQSAAVINNFISEVTNNHINNVLTSDDLAGAEMVLVNAVFFKGTWLTQFKTKNTHNRHFQTLSPVSSSVQVPMMFTLRHMNYGESTELGARLVELPYSGNIISMYLLLPKHEGVDGWSQLVQNLNADRLSRAINNLQERNVHLLLPKFKMETTIRDELKESLMRMGVTDMFSTQKANLTGFTVPPKNLSVSTIIHKSFVEVNEEGTEAAAATVVITRVPRRLHRRPPPPIEFHCNRPFMFLLRDKVTKNLLFMGSYQDPRT